MVLPVWLHARRTGHREQTFPNFTYSCDPLEFPTVDPSPNYKDRQVYKPWGESCRDTTHRLCLFVKPRDERYPRNRTTTSSLYIRIYRTIGRLGRRRRRDLYPCPGLTGGRSSTSWQWLKPLHKLHITRKLPSLVSFI